MLVQVYIAIIFFSLALFLAAFVWNANPFIPLLAGLGFLVLAGSSIYITESFCVFNSTSSEIVCVDHEPSVKSDTWMRPFWFAFFIICLVEMFGRAFLFTSKGISSSFPKRI